MPHPRPDFAAYAHAGLPGLVTTAHLLHGDPDDPGDLGNSREATELVRRTLVEVCARWRRIPRDDVDFYVRRLLVEEYLRGARTRRGKTVPHDASRAVSARQRAVLVLLHWEGLREAEIAQLLGCSTGAVRSHARRGLTVCGGDAERLRKRFAAAAAAPAEVAPFDTFDVPLDAVERRGRTLRRRRRGVVMAVWALLLGPAVVFGAGRFMGAGSTDGSDGGVAAATAQSPIRIVAPGERVDAVPGVQVWLTADGKHWSTPERPNQFLGPEGGKPGVSARPDHVRGGYFLSGLYHGLSADPARVEVTVADHRITGTVLTLAGSPGWGVWYAPTSLSLADLKSSFADGGPAVTVYDASGKVVVRGGGYA
ncbi:sigma factor-like helix-turn-helix DNA-binding protein [Streptomyces sp. NPDC101776]|uniref:sigma factor-like helix-turn-helix DNA-binding protein n=1 Tax=Streptomyces sp. NPDC101776 TaxID=3366146 RepID=UPI00380FFCB7